MFQSCVVYFIAISSYVIAITIQNERTWWFFYRYGMWYKCTGLMDLLQHYYYLIIPSILPCGQSADGSAENTVPSEQRHSPQYCSYVITTHNRSQSTPKSSSFSTNPNDSTPSWDSRNSRWQRVAAHGQLIPEPIHHHHQRLWIIIKIMVVLVVLIIIIIIIMVMFLLILICP